MAVTAVDTNVLFHALHARGAEHELARAFLASRADDADLVVSELVLVELYVLLRNPAVAERPLSAQAAADLVGAFRRHPRWRLVDHDPAVMDELWRRAAVSGFARGRVFDARLALGLVRHGVTHLATRNTKHFEGFGFTRVWDPLRLETAG